ncbi:hypothetical protein FUAX_38900 (plasmid) [Fulvitalea axinellae]|uniref:Helix-turn-helix domain-containing protein n=1 Tax=Fulvitalea axinellae TaxID=1182444 RepID=A0AAU9CMI0_9BACT|nr:hypothetical protein FUAX_38900 [Fulvitalea axinellae]
MRDLKEIDEIVSQITNSETFARSNTNITLLRFLIESSLAERELKEITIGQELFGKKYDPVKNDNKVRVYVHNLRKKLDQYYKAEGAQDSIRLNIPKGRYIVEFREITPTKQTRSERKTFLLVLIPGILLTTFFIYKSSINKISFWDSHFSNGKPTALLIGDHFTISGPLATGGNGIIRDYQINTQSDFNRFLNRKPEFAGKVSPNSIPYVTKMGIHSVFQLSNWFAKNDVPLSVSILSEWDKKKLNTENVIYVGQSKNMGILRNVFLSTNPTIKTLGGKITRNEPETNQEHIYQSHPFGNSVDFTIVSSVKGKNNNRLTFFISENDIGAINLVRYFTNPDSVISFYDRQELHNQDFTAVFKVEGWERTGFKRKLVSIDKF